ncbi:efflux transporter outer membrane subunit [Myroides sp. DF42-4-2]|uniref:efflux transporter outer membrane subunit n=1 Tax=Myroides sp. DF42-4-2 TaxID=2746726 RepID=UPI002575F331|nr:efflux transporter outer membrane subunit [Myroides sp. DF42-4-2]MDM1407599.1 efflux transporter outer membrane subunit [Myroides sp. DF42-4-2]
MKRYLYILPLALAFASCKVGKDYERPALENPSQFYSGMQVDSTVNTLAEVSWQDFFAHGELASYIQIALEQNTDLQLAIKNIDQANVLYKQSKMGLLPSLTLEVTGSHTDLSKNSQTVLSGAPRSSEDYNARLDLSWELDIWGKIRREKEASLAAYLQTQEVKRAVENRLVAEVATAYVNLLMLDEQLRIADEGLILREKTFALTQKMYEIGNESFVAVQQAEAQWLEAQELLPQIEQEIALQESAMGILLNHFPQKIQRTSTISALQFSTALQAGVPATFLSQRPDIQIAELELRKANAKVGAAQGELYPSLTISAQGGLNAMETSQWFQTPASLFGTVVGGLVQPIFQKKRLKAAYDVAVIEREKAAISFKNAVIVGYADVHDALVKIDKTQERERVVQQRVELLNTSLESTQLMFEWDKASYLEVVNAQALALQGNLNYATLKRDYLVSKIDLYRALGGH